MPAGDRTGPWGAGPMTGRGAGFCAGYGIPGYANPIPGRGWGAGGRGYGGRMGRGFGGGFGGGRGWRHRYWQTGVPGWARGGYGYAFSPDPWYGAPAYTVPSGDPGKAELTGLKEQAKYFTRALDDIKKRIDELEDKGQ